MAESLSGILPKIKRLKEVEEGLENLAHDHVVSLISPPSLRPALIAAIFSKKKRPLVVVAPTLARAEQLALEISDYLPKRQVVVFPDWESYPFESVRPDVTAISRRAEIFGKLAAGEPLLVCSALTTLLQKVPPSADKVFQPLEVKVGQEININDLAAEMVGIGYVKSPVVERAGEFAVRGSVVDIFPAQLSQPVRLDFFGDEIEYIKLMDVATQRSGAKRPAVKIYPSQEFKLGKVSRERVMGAGGLLSGEEDAHRWLPLIHDLGSIRSYFSTKTQFLIDEPKETVDEGTRFFAEQRRALSEGFAGETRFTADDYYFEPDQVFSDLVPRIDLALVGKHGEQLSVNGHRQKELAGQLDTLKKELSDLKEKAYQVIVVLSDSGEQERLHELVSDMGYESDRGADLGSSKLSLVVGHVRNGYVLPDAQLAVFGYGDIFPRREVEPKIKVRPRRQRLIDFSDLTHGELLVHEVHGIASFAGLTRKTIGGKTREYLTLDYAAGDRLYLPTEQLHRVTLFVGAEGGKPQITRLGSSDWQRTTKKVRKSLKKLAFDLLALHAKRSEAVGHSFSIDTEWQRELEAAFPYEATEDQATAIAEVKKDMERAKPMDRLVCGDVGYGKTEVAVRAAFKAILGDKQVMMVVPTTILAQQHFLTFSERFAPYPVHVAMLSRFLSTGQQKKVLDQLKKGQVDMVIGTHRLLQKDTAFKDLGLIVVDEEQRFGVNAKERLRTLRSAIDVLTLSATPIPRTMQMSLTGIRELSLIETPPEGRLPVFTSIDEYTPTIVSSAIRRELARGGQVFYVHNRVESIDTVAVKVQNLVPEARIIVGHGKMTESSLESVMDKFLKHEVDVLISTTIIESGIDIPTANTLIVERSDRFGLAQLYQLRGRVGRGHHRGYAYFTYNPGQVLTDTAIERLKTIGEFTELGAGYKIALRDLEIRGAGNILGVEQSGHMISVGFDLYCQMLKEELERAQGKQTIDIPDVSIELPVNAYLPENYIDDENLRLEAYRTIARATSEDQVDAVNQELVDRFGTPTLSVENLLKVARLRLQASSVGVTSIKLQRNRLVITGMQLKKVNLDLDYGINIKEATSEVVVQVPVGQPDVLEFVINFISDILR